MVALQLLSRYWRRSRPSVRHGDESLQPARGPWQLLIGSPADFQQFYHCADAEVRLDPAASGRQRLADVSHYHCSAGNWSNVTTGGDNSLTASQAAASLQDRANVIADWHGDGN